MLFSSIASRMRLPSLASRSIPLQVALLLPLLLAVAGGRAG